MALGRLQDKVNSPLKSQLSKPYLARLSFGIGVIGLIMGSLLACYCWGWFVCSGAFFVYPFLHGTRPLAIAAALLGILSLTVAIAQFRSEARIKEAELAARGQHQKGDILPGLSNIPDDSKVIIKDSLRDFELELPEQLRLHFVAMLQKEAVYLDFSRLSAAPFAEVRVAGHLFHWHGNAVVEGDSKKGRVWTSPVVQALINRLYDRPEKIEDWTRALDELNTDTNTPSTVIQGGLGAYPSK